jgi:hypothetical protein
LLISQGEHRETVIEGLSALLVTAVDRRERQRLKSQHSKSYGLTRDRRKRRAELQNDITAGMFVLDGFSEPPYGF